MNGQSVSAKQRNGGMQRIAMQRQVLGHSLDAVHVTGTQRSPSQRSVLAQSASA